MLDQRDEFIRHLGLDRLDRRFLRSDFRRYIRPDAMRHLRGDRERFLRPEFRERNSAPASPRKPAGDARREWRSEADELQVRREIASLRRELAVLRFAAGGYKALHHSNFQPRVPEGNPDGGQFTDGAADGRVRLAGKLPGRPTRLSVHFPSTTPGQQLRIDLAVTRTQNALTQIRRIDPDWQPRTTSSHAPYGVEGAIRHVEARAQEAEARWEQLRRGIGGNLGPPMEPAGPRTGFGPTNPRMFDGGSWIGVYRSMHNMPDLFDRPQWSFDKGTVAVTEFNGKLIFGVNSDAPGYRGAEWDSAMQVRDSLVDRYPSLLKKENSGRRPNDAFFHAEATILFRAASENGGTLAGRSFEVQTDRDLCGSCRQVLPLLGPTLGDPTVTFVNHRTGATWLLHNRSVRRVK